MQTRRCMPILGALLAWTLTLAAAPPATLKGIVVNSRGEPMRSARVFWQAADGTSPHVVHTNPDGAFQISLAREGLYELRAEATGTWSEWEHNVVVRKGANVDITLRLSRSTPPSAGSDKLRGSVREWVVPVDDAFPHDPAIDSQGRLWVTLMNANELARLDPSTGQWRLFSVPTQNAKPQGLVSDPAGNIWFTESKSGKIGRLDAKSSAVTEFPAPGASDPHTPVMGADGALWFTASEANSIARMDLQSGQARSFPVPTAHALPFGIAAGPDGGMWFCESGANKLGRIDPASGALTEFVLPEADSRPRRLVFLNTALYFTDFAGGRLGRFDINSKKFQSWPSPSGKDSQPDGIAADSSGMIWYVENGANRLMRFDPRMGLLQSFPLPSSNSAVLNMIRDAHGKIWMALSGVNKVAVIE